MPLSITNIIRLKLIFLSVHSETLSTGVQLDLGAAVGLLTHNIKVIGEDYSKLYKESFGARVLVGLVTSQGQTYTGLLLFTCFLKKQFLQ